LLADDDSDDDFFKKKPLPTIPAYDKSEPAAPVKQETKPASSPLSPKKK